MECSRANRTWIECTLSVWCCLLLCDGFPWVHLQVTGNTDGYMRSTLERFTNTLTQIASHMLADKKNYTSNTSTQPHTYALRKDSARRRAFFFFFPQTSPYAAATKDTHVNCTRVNETKALEVSGSVLCYRVETDNLSSSTRPLNNPVYKRMYVCLSYIKYTVIYIYFLYLYII